MHNVFIAIGTNLGNKEKNVQQSIEKIVQNNIHITKKSAIYKTMPYGYKDQPLFLNCAVQAETMLLPKELLYTLLSIEKQMGRVRKIHWGPRVIDLDIIFYDNLIINTPDLKIPHPDMQNREFVLKPLCDIAPGFVHPILHKTMKQLLKDLH